MQRLPEALRAHRQFIIFRAQPSKRPGKTDKIPLDWRSGEPGNAHDPNLWLSADEAHASAALWGAGHGVGFVLTAAAGIWCLDIDECALPTGQWSPLALRLLGMFPGAYVEVSHSGRGLHVWGSGPVPAHRTRARGEALELYDSGRFIALGTGHGGDPASQHPAALAALVAEFFEPDAADVTPNAGDWRTGPVPEWSGPTDDDALVQRLLRTPTGAAAAFGNRASFADLWEAREDALGRAFPDPVRPYDASGADAALASHLAWATGNDHERMLGLMWRSALARDKWEVRPAYLRDTITFCAGRTARWMCDKPAPLSAPAGGPQIAPTAGPTSEGTFLAAAAGAIPPTLVNVQAALRSAEGGIRLALDGFRDCVMLGDGTSWRPLCDVDYVRLRTTFEERGFKPVAADLMRDAVLGVATGNPIDSAQQWLASLTWDGTPRAAMALTTYFGVAPTPYAQAVGLYLFSALAARVMDPGCQVDMVPVLIGAQGVRKTTAVAALAPYPDAFGEVSLHNLGADTSRALRGKLVCELAELRGLRGAEAESIRAFITRRHEAWTPKYREFETRFPRRCVFIGTSNPRDILSDPEGHRRWLPVDVTACDPEGIEAVRDQLWAEGAALWREHGVRWGEAQRQAKGVHAEYEERDEREAVVQAWLALPESEGGPGPGWFPSSWVWTRALGGQATSYRRPDQMLVAKLLKNNRCVRNKDSNKRTWRTSGEVA